MDPSKNHSPFGHSPFILSATARVLSLIHLQLIYWRVLDWGIELSLPRHWSLVKHTSRYVWYVQAGLKLVFLLLGWREELGSSWNPQIWACLKMGHTMTYLQFQCIIRFVSYPNSNFGVCHFFPNCAHWSCHKLGVNHPILDKGIQNSLYLNNQNSLHNQNSLYLQLPALPSSSLAALWQPAPMTSTVNWWRWCFRI